MSASLIHPDIAIGLGCRKGVSGDAIATLVRIALEKIERQGSVALFTTTAKMGESGLSEAASALAMPLHFLAPESLKAVAGRAKTHSQRVLDLFGVPSIAETAALVGAGPCAELILPRMSQDGVSCAIAWTPWTNTKEAAS
jgi:cobalt-precorrin 5A hydrolase